MKPRLTRLTVHGIEIDVVRKNVKNINMRVHAPSGAVRISAPGRVGIDAIHGFAASKIDWIRRQQAKILQQAAAPRPAFVDGEIHFVWGRPHVLSVRTRPGAASVTLLNGRLLLEQRAGGDAAGRESALAAWHRDLVRARGRMLVERWQPVIGVEIRGMHVRRMKTLWGSCNVRAATIRLNTELAKRSPECIEYVVVHELVHLLEASHNARFRALMDGFLPGWKATRRLLNGRSPGRDTASPTEAATPSQG